MPTALDTTTEIQQKFFTGLEAGQKAVVTLVGTWAETMESVVSKLPELTVTEPIKPTQAFESMVGFTEKLMASQRAFAGQLFQAALPATRIPTTAAKATASKV